MAERERPVSGGKAYQKVVEAFKSRRKGATVADIAAGTGLSLATVGELVPRAADEYHGRLEVTESGEILYSFPRGFVSRYRGLGPTVKRVAGKLGRLLGAAGKAVFKVWILVMLVGYFLIFMAIALLSLCLAVAGNGRGESRGRGGGGFMITGIFNLIIRLWFYSELINVVEGRPGRAPARKRGRPLHQSIFGFVFGDGDPNAGWSEKEKKVIIAYIREKRGVISLPELMALTGLPPGEAEEAVTAFCAAFGGSPEATEEGTVVYRFDELLRRADPGVKAGPLFKSLKKFSANPGSMNLWFAIINGVNLLFGGYFLVNALGAGEIAAREVGRSIQFFSLATGEGVSFVYGVVYAFLSQVAANPVTVIACGLGLVPLVFSILFWLIPALRLGGLSRENKDIKMENFRRFAYGRIWASPGEVKPRELTPPAEAPARLAQAQEGVIKEMGSYSMPEVTVGAEGEVYAFPELEREKAALEAYRAGMDPGAAALGKTVFDSGA